MMRLKLSPEFIHRPRRRGYELRFTLGIWVWVGIFSVAHAQQAPGTNATQPQVTYSPLRRPSAPEAPTKTPPPSMTQPSVPPVETRIMPTNTLVSPTTAQVHGDLAATAVKTPSPRRRIFGISADAGLPDGANLGLVILPATWLRLSVAGGTNSAKWGGRVGLTLVPFGWGPSVSVEAGRYGVANTTRVIRAVFEVPLWVEPYLQQIGYSYFNFQGGFDLRLGNFILYAHGGYSNLRGAVRSPSPVEIKSSSGALLYRVRLGKDGQVRVHTWSAKVALIYLFAGV